MADNPIEVLDDILFSLKRQRDDGLSGFDCSEEAAARLARWDTPLRHRSPSLDGIRAELGDCRRCPLCAMRTHIVFGVGNPNAQLVFVGEGPGHEEDRQGEPFVGAAGELLTKIIQAIKLTREVVYIANIVKCRPPNNRNPEADEIKTCLPYLERQIQAIAPRFVVALGKVAAQTLLGSPVPISKLRGRFYDYGGIRLLPTYHPAYLLRNPSAKRDVWQDMQMLMKVYDYDA
ncbi:MAG: uracil-DNA glycosylase [Desulfobacterales bacterium]|jgi:DNA polymerase